MKDIRAQLSPGAMAIVKAHGVADPDKHPWVEEEAWEARFIRAHHYCRCGNRGYEQRVEMPYVWLDDVSVFIGQCRWCLTVYWRRAIIEHPKPAPAPPPPPLPPDIHGELDRLRIQADATTHWRRLPPCHDSFWTERQHGCCGARVDLYPATLRSRSVVVGQCRTCRVLYWRERMWEGMETPAGGQEGIDGGA